MEQNELHIKQFIATRNLGYENKLLNVQIFFENVPEFRFFCFFGERNLMDSSYILWNKFQDYQLGFILINHFLVTA